MRYLGDFAEDATVVIAFTTNDATGAAVAPSDAFEAADLAIYKDGGAAQKTTTNGVTMTSPFDAVTGLHLVSIDTANDTGDAGFWTTGSDFAAVLNPDTETVDGQTVVAVIGSFSLENRFMRGTDAAALASAYTAARAAFLDELAAGNIPFDVDLLLARLSAIRAANLDEVTAARLSELDAVNLPADVDTMLARATEARLAELDAANLPADLDTLLARLTAARAALLDAISEARLAELDGANLPTDVAANLAAILALNNLSAAEVNAEVDTALSDLNLGALVQITSSVADPAPGASSFIAAAGLSATDDFYNGQVLVFTSGAHQGIARRVDDYVGATRTITLTTALTSAPADTDAFVIAGMESPASGGGPSAGTIADAVLRELIADHSGVAGSLAAEIANIPDTGDGSVVVDETATDDAGDTLRAVDGAGAGLDDVVIRFYLTTDYDAGDRGAAFVIARTTTDENGDFAAAVAVDPGAYTVVYTRGDLNLSTTTITVA